VLCAAILVSYIETVFNLATSHFLCLDGVVIPNTSISFIVGQIFEYDLLVCCIMLIMSIAIEACKWNLWATFYAFVHIAEKSYFDFELEPTTIYIICVINIVVSFYITFKGIKILLSK
jgi:hypothetical protein